MNVDEKVKIDIMPKTPKSENSKQSLWKWAFILVCLILILGNLALILLVFPGSGWDFRVNISAVIAAAMHLNPYNAGVISQISQVPDIPFGYPPYILAFFYVLAIPRFFHIYYIIWTMFLVCSYYIITRLERPYKLYLFTIIVTGFISSFWSFLTGNQGTLYLLLISLVLYFIILKREYLSSFCIGLLSAFNLFPLLFSSIYFFLHKDIKKRIIIILVPFITIFILFILSFFFTPGIFLSYIEMMMGGTPWEGSGADVPVSFFINTPTSYWMINQICIPLGLQDSMVFFALCVGYAILIGGIWYLFYKRNRENELNIMSFSILGIFLLLPRLKPYYFTIILVPLYFLTKEYTLKRKIVVLFLVSFIPFIFFILYQFSQNILTSFSQFWACLAIFIVIFHYSEKRKTDGIHVRNKESQFR